MLSLLAKGGDGHVADMHSVFGRSQKHAALNDLFRAITRKIDAREGDNLNYKLKALSNNKFTEGVFNHRIYFHWGFNGDPKDSPALVRQVNLATTNEVVREEMFELVRRVHIRRKEEILLQVQIVANSMHDKSAALKRQEMNAIAALAYDVHILGDYIEGSDKTIQAILSIDKLNHDINRVFKLLVKYDDEFRNHPNRPILLKKFLHSMNKAIRKGAKSAAGEDMLKLMRVYVPELLLMTGRTKRALGLYDGSVGEQANKTTM